MIQEGFTLLLTTDQNLRYQQNLQQAGVAVIVLVAPSNRLDDLVHLMPKVFNILIPFLKSYATVGVGRPRGDRPYNRRKNSEL